MNIRNLLLSVAAFCRLIAIDVALRRGGFADLRKSLQQISAQTRPHSPITAEQVCEAIGRASLWYQGCSPCLVRAIVTAKMLRAKAGVSAQVVLGVQMFTFRGHAWVERQSTIIDVEQEDLVRTFVEIDRF